MGRHLRTCIPCFKACMKAAGMHGMGVDRSWPPALVNPTHSPTPQTCLASRHALHLHAAGPLLSAPAPRGATYSSSCCCLPAQGPGDQRVSAAAAPLAQRAVVAQVRAHLACVLGSGPAAVPCEFGYGAGGGQTAFSAVTIRMEKFTRGKNQKLEATPR